MPVPYTYRHASTEFSAFIADARHEMGLDSDNMTYTAIDAVFQVFRARLTVPQAFAFADVLPAVLRAICLWRWTPAPPLPWADRATLTRAAQHIRPHHNLTPDDVIAALPRCLRHHVTASDLDHAFACLPPEAAAFWHVPPDEAAGLTVRFP